MDRQESPSSGSRERRTSAAAIVVLALIGILVLPFLPLLLSGLEEATLGSNRVEHFFKQVGLHDELSTLYEPLLDFIK